MRGLFVLAVFLALHSAANANPRYFPPKTFDHGVEGIVVPWYSEQLDALQEPSLFEQSTSKPSAMSYRFLWLRTFDHPLAVRLDVQPDGTSILTLKIADGAGGYKPGKLITNQTKRLSVDDTKLALDRIRDADFWKLPTETKRSGMDGSEWVIEGASGGRYHLSQEWTPETGSIHDLGTMFLFDLAKLQVPKDQIY